jgi:hypothetical protein
MLELTGIRIFVGKEKLSFVAAVFYTRVSLPIIGLVCASYKMTLVRRLLATDRKRRLITCTNISIQFSLETNKLYTRLKSRQNSSSTCIAYVRIYGELTFKVRGANVGHLRWPR